jgi:hypothetical protein
MWSARQLLLSGFLCAALAAYATVTGASIASAAPKPEPSASPAADGQADYDKLVKDATKAPGLFTVWQKDGKVYLELAADQLDRDYIEHVLPENGLGGFGFEAGQMFDQEARVVRFHRNGKQVVMIWPQTRFLAQPGTPLATAVRESTADSVEAILPVAAENKAGKTVVVDLAPLLGDILDIGNALSDAVKDPKNPQGGYDLDSSRTYFGPIKAFPSNLVVEAEQTFKSAKPDVINTVPDARFIQMRVKYNFSEILNSPDYMPRLYDDRVGYWEDPHIAFDNDRERDNHLWYILRWNMRASDPSKPLSPAVKPIVFYLDNSIPVEYREAVRDGVLEWNKAFARIGISNAIEVLDPPADPNWDPDDIRYSVIRWLTNERSPFGAEAQILWNPRTGEIFRGGVLLDSNIVRSAKRGEDILLRAFANPAASGAISPLPLRTSYSPLHDEDTFDSGEALQAAFGATALELSGDGMSLDDYSNQLLKAIVMHEVGHDFGLAHNFIAHNAYTQAGLRDKAFTQAFGTSASVMDYWPTNIWPKGMSSGDWFPQTLGTYDYHVIHWGYAAVPGAKTPQDEVAVLDRWASASTDPHFRFASDEDGFFDGHAIDPRTAPYVLSNHPIEWCSVQLEFTRGLFSRLDQHFPKPQQPWADERSAFLSLLSRYATCADTMTHYVAGEYLSRGRIGDPGIKTALTPVPRSEELRAYQMLDRYMLSDMAWQFSPTTLKRLTYTEFMPFADFGYDPAPRHDVPVAELIGALQNRALGYMFSPLVLERLNDMPTKTKPGETMSLADLFSWTQHAVYADLVAGRPSPSEIHRNLQRRYTRLLAELITAPATGTPLDAQALARLELSTVSADVTKELKRPGLDLQTQAHLRALQVDASRALDAKMVLPPAED